MVNIHSRWALDNLKQQADGLTAAGIGLEAIGQLLNEGDLHADHVNGLEHAVKALGDYVRRAGFDMHGQLDKLQGGAQ